MRDLEREQQKALEGLSKAIGDEKPKTMDILSSLIAFRVEDLVKQAGEPELACLLFGEYLDSLYYDTWQKIDAYILSILQKKLFSLITKYGIENGSEKFQRYLRKAGTEGSEKAGYPMRNKNE